MALQRGDCVRVFLDDEAKRKWFAPQKDNYALGWYRVERHNTKVQYHVGAAPGAKAYFARIPDKDITYAFFLSTVETEKRPEYRVARDLEAILLAD